MSTVKTFAANNDGGRVTAWCDPQLGVCLRIEEAYRDDAPHEVLLSLEDARALRAWLDACVCDRGKDEEPAT